MPTTIPFTKEHVHIDDLILSLQDAAVSLFKWFSDNQMELNIDNVTC